MRYSGSEFFLNLSQKKKKYYIIFGMMFVFNECKANKKKAGKSGHPRSSDQSLRSMKYEVKWVYMHV